MDTLAPSLTSHQKSATRRPSLSLTLHNTAHGRTRFNWQPLLSTPNDDNPVAATVTTDGLLVRAHNDDGTLRVTVFHANGSASTFTLESITPNTGLALATDPNSGQITLVFVDSSARRLRYRTTTDPESGSGSWSTAATILTESSDISHLALGSDDATGNLVLFYLLDSTTTLKYVRRTSGTWGSSGTTWSQAANFHTITGIAAARFLGNQHIVITGTAATTQRPTLWGMLFGDGALPPGIFGAPIPIIDLDPDSTSSFHTPSLAFVQNTAAITFTWQESGNVPFTRVYFTQPATGGVSDGTTVEPYPTPADHPHGAAITASGPHAYLATPAHIWHSDIASSRNLSQHLISADWSYTPTGTRATFTLDDATGALAHGLQPAAGMDLQLSAGYASGTSHAHEAGETRAFRIEHARRSFARDGRRTVQLRCTGPWETLDHWRSPIAHQFAAGTMNRQELFHYFTGRAGVTPSGQGDRWGEQEPGFALNPGESARTALLRLLAPTNTVIRHEDGSITALDPPTDSEYTYGAGEHPILEAHTIDQAPQTNWLRIQGEDRYADAHDFAALAAHGPRFAVQRQLYATTNSIAQDFAEEALERANQTVPALELRVPYHAGQRLHDVVSVQLAELDIDADYRVVTIHNHYARQPSTATYTTTLTLARIDD